MSESQILPERTIYNFVDFILEKERQRRLLKEETQKLMKDFEIRKNDISKKQKQLFEVDSREGKQLKQSNKLYTKLTEQNKYYDEEIDDYEKKVKEIQERIFQQRMKEEIILNKIEEEENVFEDFVDKNDQQYKLALVQKVNNESKILFIEQSQQILTSLQQQNKEMKMQLQTLKNLVSQNRNQFAKLQQQKIIEQIEGENSWIQSEQRIDSNLRKIKQTIENSKQNKYKSLMIYFMNTKQSLELTEEQKQYLSTNYFQIYNQILEQKSEKLVLILKEYEEFIQENLFTHEELGNRKKEQEAIIKEKIIRIQQLDQQIEEKDLQISSLQEEVERKQKIIDKMGTK